MRSDSTILAKSDTGHNQRRRFCSHNVHYILSIYVASRSVRIHLSALGCRLNEAELEQWASAFNAAGDQITDIADNADVMVLNTCAVTSEAVRKSRQRIQRLQRANPNAKMVVTGCYSSLEKPAVLAELGIDLVVPNTEKESLVPMTRAQFQSPVMPEAATIPAESVLFQRHRQRAFIKIQDGCRYRCTFCIVTVARGSERSRTINDIIKEVQQLHRQGIQEVVLTGVHVGGYGSDLNTDLFTLVKALLDDTSIPRIRFASVEPWDLSDQFLTLFSNHRVMPHMHLPLQSGCDSVLRRMARRCKTSDYSQLLNELETAAPGFNVTTDIIVGFPGETEEEWQQTLTYINGVTFGHMHIFSYSERDGTKAATLPNKVPKTVRQARSRELHGIAAMQTQAKLRNTIEQYRGCTVPVLWERAKQEESGQFKHFGYTPNYLKVCTLSNEDVANQIIPAELSDIEQGCVTAII